MRIWALVYLTRCSLYRLTRMNFLNSCFGMDEAINHGVRIIRLLYLFKG